MKATDLQDVTDAAGQSLRVIRTSIKLHELRLAKLRQAEAALLPVVSDGPIPNYIDDASKVGTDAVREAMKEVEKIEDKEGDAPKVPPISEPIEESRLEPNPPETPVPQHNSPLDRSQRAMARLNRQR